MVVQIVLGLIMTAITVGFGAFSIIAGAESIRRREYWLFGGERFSRHIVALIFVSTWLVIGMLFVIVLWAALLVTLGIFPRFEPALYFSMISFTTLGFGDVILPIEWRLLSGFIAVDGFLLFGLNTAFIFEVLQRLRNAAGVSEV